MTSRNVWRSGEDRASSDRETSLGTLRGLLGDKKALLVASTGGHLAQLWRLASENTVRSDSLWVTFQTAQSESLLKNQRVIHVPYIPPRGWKETVRASRTISKILSREDFDVIVSTGAGLALASHLQASARRLHPVYIESVSRVDGPSLSGRILERVPGVHRYAQHPWGETRRGWTHKFSVLDTFKPTMSRTATSDRPRRYFVTLGTIHPYEFESLVRAVESSLPSGTDVTWQLGSTRYRPSFGEVHYEMSSSDFAAAVAAADTVITHAGVGTVLALVENGVDVIAVPRRAHRGEHVDDHQLQICAEFGARGLVRAVEVEDIPRVLAKESKREL